VRCRMKQIRKKSTEEHCSQKDSTYIKGHKIVLWFHCFSPFLLIWKNKLILIAYYIDWSLIEMSFQYHQCTYFDFTDWPPWKIIVFFNSNYIGPTFLFCFLQNKIKVRRTLV
jgi:hypothetical protein